MTDLARHFAALSWLLYMSVTHFFPPEIVLPEIGQDGWTVWWGKQEVSAAPACWVPISSPAGVGENVVGKGRD